MMPDGDEGWPAEIGGQYLEEDMHHRRISFVVDGMIDIAGFEKEIARAVDDRLVRQDVCHVSGGNLPNPRTLMVVLAHMSARRQRQLGDPQLVLSVDLLEKSGKRCLEFDVGNQPLRIDPDRAATGLRRRFIQLRRQRQQWQGRERLQEIPPHWFVACQD